MRLLWRLRAWRARRGARGQLSIARATRIDGGVRIEVEREARLSIGPGCHLEPHARVFVRAGVVELGAGVVLGERSTVVALRRVTMGARSRLGPRAAVMDFKRDGADGEAIARRVALAARPVEIGEGAIVEAGAVVEGGTRVRAAERVAPGVVLARDELA